MAVLEGEIMQDHEGAAHFSAKARSAEAGHVTEPDNPQDYDLPAYSRSDLTKARSELLDAVPRAGVGKNDLYLARAQARYDCWIRQVRENPDSAYRSSCREAFYAAMGLVDLTTPLPTAKPQDEKPVKAAKIKPAKPKKKTAPATKPEISAPAPVLGHYTLYFDYNSAALNDSAKGVVKDMARDHFARAEVDKIVMTGYADGVDSEANRKLAHRRMVAVKNALILYGANPSLIDTDHTIVIAGEKDTDGTPLSDPKDRRVEVKILAVLPE